MAYLKEDGSLDVDRYRKLSNEDYKKRNSQTYQSTT